MGNDGGSIPKRVDMVKFKKKEIKKDAVAVNKMRAKYCAISNKKLKKPIMGCKMGYLYSKETILECLIKKTVPKAFHHIKKLKHVKDIVIDEDQTLEFPLICPLTKEVHNGINKFIFLWKCGCMMSYEAFKAAKGSTVCPYCSKPHKKKIVKLWDSIEEMVIKKKKMFGKMEDSLEEEGAGLGKREALEELPEYGGEKGRKMLKKGKNILDDIAKGEFDQGLYKSMFHKDHKVGDANELLFRNVRFGIR